nr:hypothetical protein [Tanacetum cinerariifolium]
MNLELRSLKKKSVKRLVEERVAKAIEEYEKTRADLHNARSSRRNSKNAGGTVNVQGDDIKAYNNRFHELALMCPDLVPNEKKKVKMYIQGFPERIKGNINSSKPTICTRKSIWLVNWSSKQFRVRLQGRVKAIKGSPAEGRGYTKNLPWCNRCKAHHQPWLCPPRCSKCHKLGHEEEDCRTRIPVARGNSLQNVTCFGCREKGHYRDKCPRGRNSQNEGARGRPYLMRTKEPQKDPNYLQNEHYALWEVIEFGDSYKAPPEETGKGPPSESSTMKKGRTVVITAEDMQKIRNDVKARTTLLLALPDEHQNEATKKTKKNQLKQQCGNFKAEGLETLEQTFNKLQAIMSHLEFMDVEIEQDDLNQKFLTSLVPEWLMYTIVWRNRDDLDTMSLDDVYNHLKVYEPEVKDKQEKDKIESKPDKNGKRGEAVRSGFPSFSLPFCLNGVFAHCSNKLRVKRGGKPAIKHQLRFSKYETAKELWEAILKTFGGNEATKKTKKNQLKQQYSNFKAEDDLNQKFLTSLSPKWLMYIIVWRNKDDLDTMSLDDVYNHLKVYEPEVQKKSESNSQNMTFISSSNTSSGKGKVHTASVPTVSTQVSTASTDVAAASLSHDTVCAYISSQSNGSQIRYEDITQIDKEDIEEIDIKWNMALLSMRADRFWKKTGKKITIQGSDVAGFDKSKVECFNCHKMGHFARECRTPRSQDRGKRESYKQADDEVPTKFALMAKSSSSSENEVEARLVEFKEQEIKFCEKIRGLKRDVEVRNNKIEYLMNELEQGVKDQIRIRRVLDIMQFPPPPAQVYLPPKKDLSWTGLPEFVDDTFTNYNRPTPSIDTSKCNTSDLQSSNFSISEHRESSGSIMSKPMIKFVKAADCPRTNNTENARKSTVKYAEMYGNTSKSSKVKGNQRNWNNLKSQQLGKYFLMQNKACFKCGYFDHLASDCGVRVEKGKTWPKNNFAHKNVTPIAVLLKTGKTPIAGNSQNNIDDKGYWDSGCSRHITGNISYLSKYEPYDGGYVSFGQGGGKITENLKDLKVKIIRCDNGGEFKNKEMNEFCTKKGIRREFSNARTPQQNRVAKRRNRTLIKAARTMLADAKLPVTFWAEAVNTACYVQNRVLVNKSQNKTPYEIFNSRTPAIGFLRPFRCYVMILNTLDHLGKLDAKGDEGYFVGYSLSSKAFKVFNKRTKKVEENLHVDFLENKHIKKGAGPNWLFDIDTLTNSMNYVPVVIAETSSSNISAHMETRNSDAPDGCNADDPESSGISNPTATSKLPSAKQVEPVVSLTMETEIPTETPSLDNALNLSNRFEDTSGMEADLSNMETSIPVSPTPTFRIHKDHPKSQIIGPIDTPVQTRHKSKEIEEQSFIATIHQKTNPDLLQFCLFSCFLSQEEPKKIFDALKDPIARIEAIRLFLAYASFMGFIVYQMDVKSTFLYGTIDEEVYVLQPPGFQDPEFPDRVYKVEKAMYGLHQAPRAWYVLQKKDGIFLSQDKYVGDILKKFGYSDVRSANTPMNKENPWGKDRSGKDWIFTASRPDIMFAVCACARHQVTPKECHLHAVKRIFRYLKGYPKMGLWYPKDSPFDLVAYSDSDYGGATQDKKSTTGGCQFLGRRLISWQCKKQTIMATSTTEAEYIAAASGCGQVLWIQNQMLDYGNFIMAKLAFCDYHNMIAILEKTEHNTDFHEIVDFLEASHIRYALTISPTIYVSHVRQFWSTARIETTNQETKILTTIDGKRRTISESSLRRHLKLNDEEGISSLPDAELFKNLSLMGYNGEGLGNPTEPHHTPSPQEHYFLPPLHPTTTSEQIPQALTEPHTYRQYTRRATRIAQSKALSPAADKPASLLRDDRQGEAFPTVFSLDARQDRENVNKTSALPHESSPRFTSLDADECSIQQRLYELMKLCTSLQRQQSQMVAKIKDQDLDISRLKARVKSLKDKERRSAEPTQEDAPITWGIRKIGEELGAKKNTELGSNDTEEMVNVLSSMEAANILTSGVAAASVSPASGVSTACVPTVSGSFVTPEKFLNFKLLLYRLTFLVGLDFLTFDLFW